MTLLPSAQTVVEVLENVEADDLVVAACERLKVAGYTLALDDFVAKDPREAPARLADILKVDFGQTSPGDREQMMKVRGSRHCRMLAERPKPDSNFTRRVTWDSCTSRLIFFHRPEVLKAREIPANRVNYIRMLSRSRATKSNSGNLSA